MCMYWLYVLVVVLVICTSSIYCLCASCVFQLYVLILCNSYVLVERTSCTHLLYVLIVCNCVYYKNECSSD